MRIIPFDGGVRHLLGDSEVLNVSNEMVAIGRDDLFVDTFLTNFKRAHKKKKKFLVVLT